MTEFVWDVNKVSKEGGVKDLPAGIRHFFACAIIFERCGETKNAQQHFDMAYLMAAEHSGILEEVLQSK